MKIFRFCPVSLLVLVTLLPAPRADAQTGAVSGPVEKVPLTRPQQYTDYKNPTREGDHGGVPHYRITVCDNNNKLRWEISSGLAAPAAISGPTPPPARGARPSAAVTPTSGTNGSVEIKGLNEGTSDFEITLDKGLKTERRIHLTVRVVNCSANLAPGTTRGLPPPPGA
jgi:hypothetical protein